MSQDNGDAVLLGGEEHSEGSSEDMALDSGSDSDSYWLCDLGWMT